jgi:hypothetical protein
MKGYSMKKLLLLTLLCLSSFAHAAANRDYAGYHANARNQHQSAKQRQEAASLQRRREALNTAEGHRKQHLNVDAARSKHDNHNRLAAVKDDQVREKDRKSMLNGNQVRETEEKNSRNVTRKNAEDKREAGEQEAQEEQE